MATKTTATETATETKAPATVSETPENKKRRAADSVATQFKVLTLAFIVALRDEVQNLSQSAQEAYHALEAKSLEVSTRSSIAPELKLATVNNEIDAMLTAGVAPDQMAKLQEKFLERSKLEKKIADIAKAKEPKTDGEQKENGEDNEETE